MKNRPLGFTLRHDTATNRTVYRFSCTGCHAVLDVTWGTLNPSAISKLGIKAGWLATEHHANLTKCPACRAIKALRRHDPELELRKVAAVMNSPIRTIPLAAEGTVVVPPRNPPALVGNGATAPPAPIQGELPREPTGDQRVAIRNYLDKHFDDSVGCYLDGMSDQRIAELAGVPRVVVERIRESAYGPIRVSPELQTLRDSLATIKGVLAAHKGDLDKITAHVAELASRVERAIAGR